MGGEGLEESGGDQSAGRLAPHLPTFWEHGQPLNQDHPFWERPLSPQMVEQIAVPPHKDHVMGANPRCLEGAEGTTKSKVGG